MIDWDKEFRECKGFMTYPPSLMIANFKPNGNNARNIFQDDKKQILAAAEKYGFRQMDSGSHISFIMVVKNSSK